MTAPSPADIRTARGEMTQTQAAELIHCHYRAWQQWESGQRGMHLAMWELYLIKAHGVGLAGVGKVVG